MKTKKFIVFFMIVLSIVPAAFAMKEQKPQTSGTRKASCVIRIIIDSHILPVMDADKNILSILRSSGVGVRSAQEILGYEPKQLSDGHLLQGLITINTTNSKSATGIGSDYIYSFELEINATEADIGAESPKANALSYMRALTDGLKENLNKSFEDYKQRMNQQVKIAEENAKNAEKEFYTLQEQMRKISGLRDFSQKKLISDINNLQTQIDRCEFEISNSEAYLEDLPKQVENTRKRIEEKLKTDAILIELENVVRILQKQFDSVKKLADYGQGPSQDLILAEEKSARAQLEVTRRKEELQRPSGRDSIDSLNDRIAQFSVMRAQSNKRLNSAQQQLDEARKLLGKADDYEVLSIKADIARSSLRRALQALEDLKRNADLVPPTITVMGD